jgi:hypothetical protein
MGDGDWKPTAAAQHLLDCLFVAAFLKKEVFRVHHSR